MSLTGKISWVWPAWVTLDRWHLKVKLSFALNMGGGGHSLPSITGPQAYIRVGWVDVLDCHTPFYGAKSKASWLVLLVFEDTDAPVLVLQWALYSLQRGSGHAHISWPCPPHHAYLELGRSVLQLVDHQTSGGCAHKSHGVHLFEGALAQNIRQV